MKKIFLIGLLFMLPGGFSVAAELLSVEPAAPAVEIGGTLVLSVSGASGEVVWTPSKGQIPGAGLRVTYLAPAQIGTDVVTIFDETGNIEVIFITVLPQPAARIENANWKMFSHRGIVNALSLSSDGEKILWTGTDGGVEQREAESGRLIRFYTMADGLPTNRIIIVQADGSGGVWAGTEENGMAHLKEGAWKVFNADNSGLTNNSIDSLLADGNGGVWAGAGWGGLMHFDENGLTEVFNSDNSELPSDRINALISDGNGGIWAGTRSGAGHLYGDGHWEVFHTGNSGLPSDDVADLSVDGSGGLWIAFTFSYGISHFKADGSWENFTAENSALPGNWVSALQPDGSGGVWINMISSMAHLKADGGWEMRSVEPLSLLYDGKQGVWIGSNGDGLVHIHANGDWETLDMEDANLPANWVKSLQRDGNGGIWVATWGDDHGDGGAARLHADGHWETFHTGNSGLLSDSVASLAIDARGGVWFGGGKTEENGGLAYLGADGAWQTFTSANSILPDNHIRTLLSDGSGGLWAGTRQGKLVHIDAYANWQTFDGGNAGLPDNRLTPMLSDGRGGLWVSSFFGGIAHYDGQSAWQVYDTDSVGLSDAITAVQPDGSDGIWIGTLGVWDDTLGGITNGKLAHLAADGAWKVFTAADSVLPGDPVLSLLADGEGGVWIGTGDSGGHDIRGKLSYLDANGGWEVIDTGINPNVLEADGSGGLWVGSMRRGVAHLTFSRKQSLARNIAVEENRTAMLTHKRAAILIHPDGRGHGYSQEHAVEFMATYAYQTLYARGYDNDEIYLLSHKPNLDFNRDGQADANIVDAPVPLAAFRAGAPLRNITVADVQAAFEWAKAKGKLDEPLLVIFVDHGIPNGVLLDPLGEEILTTEILDALLDDYQQGPDDVPHPVAVILEACHTGTLLPSLAAPGRLIISSTGEDLAYYDDAGRISFLKLYFDALRQGVSFRRALEEVSAVIASYRSPLNRQRPQLNDYSGEMAGSLCLNGCFGSLPGVLTLTVDAPPSTVLPGETVELNVQTNIPGGSVRSVWASVLTPEVAEQRTAQGYSRLPAPVVYLRKKENNQWQGRFDAFSTRGDYAFSIKAEDNNGFVTEASPVSLSVEKGQKLAYAVFDATAGILHLPAITIPNAAGALELYQADFSLSNHEPFTLVPDFGSLQPVSEDFPAGYANFNPAAFTLHIPVVETANAAGGTDRYSVDLNLDRQAEDIQFLLGKIIPLTE